MKLRSLLVMLVAGALVLTPTVVANTVDLLLSTAQDSESASLSGSARPTTAVGEGDWTLSILLDADLIQEVIREGDLCTIVDTGTGGNLEFVDCNPQCESSECQALLTDCRSDERCAEAVLRPILTSTAASRQAAPNAQESITSINQPDIGRIFETSGWEDTDYVVEQADEGVGKSGTMALGACAALSPVPPPGVLAGGCAFGVVAGMAYYTLAKDDTYHGTILVTWDGFGWEEPEAGQNLNIAIDGPLDPADPDSELSSSRLLREVDHPVQWGPVAGEQEAKEAQEKAALTAAAYANTFNEVAGDVSGSTEIFLVLNTLLPIGFTTEGTGTVKISQGDLDVELAYSGAAEPDEALLQLVPFVDWHLTLGANGEGKTIYEIDESESI